MTKFEDDLLEVLKGIKSQLVHIRKASENITCILDAGHMLSQESYRSYTTVNKDIPDYDKSN